MAYGVMHQFLAGATANDAITEQAILMKRWLRDLGFASEIYALHIEPSAANAVLPFSKYRRQHGENFAIVHHSIGSEITESLVQQGFRIILVYHNITPSSFFQRTEPVLAHLSQWGRRQLEMLRPHTALVIADSFYNAEELRIVGYGDVAVLPLSLEPERYDVPVEEPLADKLAEIPLRLLFIGRLSANKRQEDLIKLLYYVRRIVPQAHLYLVGSHWQPGYANWLQELAAQLGVDDGLTMTGKVSQREMVTYLKAADMYVSMSEHEGFGVPLIESMYFGVPVMAYDITAVAETLGGVGVLFRNKDFEHLAELVVILCDEISLRERIIACQRRRVEDFLEPNVRIRFVKLLEGAGVC